MKLRGLTCDFIKYIVGDGQFIWMWVDNWHNLGPLVKQFGDRIAYDAGSNLKAKVKEFIVNNRWHMPRFTSNALLAIRETWLGYDPDGNLDRVEWCHTVNKKLSCKSVWEALRLRRPVVQWYKVVWHGDCVPRCSFMCWMAC